MPIIIKNDDKRKGNKHAADETELSRLNQNEYYKFR